MGSGGGSGWDFDLEKGGGSKAEEAGEERLRLC